MTSEKILCRSFSDITRKRYNRKEDVNHETDLLEKRFYLMFIYNMERN